MIRINLLPIRAAKKRELGRQWLVLFALVAVGALVGNYMWLNKSKNSLKQVQIRVTRYQNDIKQLEKIIGEVKDIREAKAEIQRKLTVLRELKNRRVGPVRTMDELAELLPERVTLLDLNIKQSEIELTGFGTTHDEVAEFMLNLKESPYFGEARLGQARAVGPGRVQFNITSPRKRP